MRNFDLGTDYFSDHHEETVSPSDSDDDRSVTMREVEALIRRLTARMERLIVEGIESVREDFRHEIGQLETRLAAPSNPCQQFPARDQITKIRVQMFNNETNPSPKTYGKKKGGVPNFRLKLYVWTCPLRETRRHLEGTCGNFYIPIYKPNIAATRKRIGTNLDYLAADDAKFIGALTVRKYGTSRFWDQAAVIYPDNHLYLHIRGQQIDCGMPRTAPDDWNPGASVLNWYFPDQFIMDSH